MFDDVIARISGHRQANLLKRGDSFNFTALEPTFKNIRLMLPALRSDTISSFLPDDRANGIETTLNNIDDAYNRIEAFNPTTQPTPTETQQNLINEVRQLYQQLYDQCMQLVAFYQASRITTTSVEQEINKVQGLAKDASSALKEIEKIVQEAKEAAGVIATASYAETFAKEATRNWRMAMGWLAISIGAIGGIGWYLLNLSNEIVGEVSKSSVNNAQAIQITLAKLIIVPLGYYIIYQALKNYNVRMHLFVVARQRENSLKTFEALRDAGKGDSAKDTILLQASQTIFGMGESGYLSGKQSSDDLAIVKVIEQLIPKEK